MVCLRNISINTLIKEMMKMIRIIIILIIREVITSKCKRFIVVNVLHVPHTITTG